MNKRFLLACIWAATICVSCTDELAGLEGSDMFAQESEVLQSRASSAEIVYRGESDTLWVGTNKEVQYDLYCVTDEDNPNAVWFTDARGKKVYIEKSNDFTLTQQGEVMLTSEIPETAANAYVVSLKVKGEVNSFPMMLSVRNQAAAANAASASNTDVTRNLRAADYLCHPIAYDTVPRVNMNVTWLDKIMISQGMTADNNSNISGKRIEPVITNLLNASTWLKKTTGKTSQKDSHADTQEVGLSAKFPALNQLFSIAGSFNRKKRTSTQTEREWIRYSVLTVAMTANIDKDALQENPTLYLTKGLNDVLNTNYPKILEMYPLTEEGTFKILDEYGVALSTTGAFGAYTTSEYERNANVTSESLEWGFSLSFNGAQYGEQKWSIGEMIKLFTQYKYGINTAKSQAAFNVGYSSSREDYQEAVEATSSTCMFGGNCLTETDYTKWNATTNPENWNLISFSTNNTPDNEGTNLLTLLDMIQDPNSQRAQLLRKALYGDVNDETTFLNEDCPYFKHLEPEPADNVINKTVVADVYLKVIYPGSDGHTLTDNPKSFVMADSKGRKHIYHPFILNQNSGRYVNGDLALPSMLGYGFLVGASSSDLDYWNMWWDFVDGKHNGNALAVYYALDDYKNCNAVVDLFFADPSSVYNTFYDGYVKRGASISEAFGQDENRALYVKYANDEDAKDIRFPHVTGVALVAGNRKNSDRSYRSCWISGVPFATTAGTEWTPSDKSVFDYYWGENVDSVYTTILDYNGPGAKTINICNVVANYSDAVGKTPRFGYSESQLKKYDVRGNTLRTGVIDGLQGVYYPGRTYDTRYYVDGQKYTTTHTSTLYGRSGKDTDDAKTAVHLNYTTKCIDPNHYTAPRQAKLWPYHD